MKQLFTKTNNCHAARLVEKKKKRLLQTFAMFAAVLADFGRPLPTFRIEQIFYRICR